VNAAAAQQQLLDFDRAWSQASASGNVDSIVSFWTADGRVLLSGQPPYVGTDAIRKMVTASLAIPGFAISWTPDGAVVSTSGDLGYTYGTNRITVSDTTGKPKTTMGRYVEVWRKEADGRWRCTIDVDNDGPA
jgi:uncharacterized protein (TIGR02246 family)